MSIQSLYNKTVSTKRLGAVSGTYKKTEAVNLASLVCTIHPVDGSSSEALGSAFYKTFKLWCDVDTDILVGDIVLDGSTRYTVRGVSSYDFGRNNHLEVLIVLGE